WLELVERKGLGHPDTIADTLVEEISVALNRMYLERLGAVAHYNIDKALLVAGQCAKGFGWGEMTRPMGLYVGDRATDVAGRGAAGGRHGDRRRRSLVRGIPAGRPPGQGPRDALRPRAGLGRAPPHLHRPPARHRVQ